MKQMKGVCLVLALLVSMTSSLVMAHGGHYRGHGGYGFGFYSGFPWPFYYPFYPPYYTYPPAIVTVPAPPQVYIQRDSRQTAPQRPANYWYYCRDPDGYYPYVRQCPGGWQQVAPLPSVR
jgi:hypothetical protein